MQLSEDQIHLSLNHIIEKIWKTNAQSIMKLGEGVYGRCYGVTFGISPYRAIVKIHKYHGMVDQERGQLIALRTHMPVLIPQVYTYLPATELGDVIVMEWLDGQSCPKPELFSYTLRASLQHQVVDLLLQLHSVEHPQGYGSFDGPFYPSWWDYYGQRVRYTYQTIINDEQARSYLGFQVLALMEHTLEHGERILSTSTGRPVLLHGDFCFGNLLFDPHTWRISGLIDPLDAEWGDRELDLVNLINGHVHHFELLNRYREKIDLDVCFPLRYWFYQIWKWLFYYTRVRTACREWVLRCGRELEKAMDRYL